MKVLFPKLPSVFLFGKEFLLQLGGDYIWKYKGITIVCHIYGQNAKYILIKSTNSSYGFYYENIGSNIDLQDYLDSNQGKIALCINKEFNGEGMMIYDYVYPALIADLKELISIEQLNKLLILI